MNSFLNCKSLTDITIPDTVESIDYGAFSGCSSLVGITLPNKLNTIDSVAFQGCDSLKNVIIPDSVEMIGWGAFANCPNLNSVTIPKSVTEIGSYAFGYTINYEEYDDYDKRILKVANFTIKGYRGTAAEAYANENGFNFIALGEDIITGDADGNSTVNVNDVTHLQFHITGKKNPDGSPFINIENKAIFDSIDMNKDGKLDVQDVTALQIYIAGNENA